MVKLPRLVQTLKYNYTRNYNFNEAKSLISFDIIVPGEGIQIFK